MVPGVFWAESEFDAGLNATCGPNARAMAICWADQKYLGQPVYGQTATYASYARMRALGLCAPNGVTQAAKIAASLDADKYRVARWDRGGYLSYLQARFAEPAVSVILVNQGHDFVDYLTKEGEDAGSDLAGHFVTACEYHPGGLSARAGGVVLPAGIFAADGDSNVNNPIVGGRRTRRIADHRLQFYPLDVLAAANPVDIVSVYPRVAFGPVYTVPSGLPGWRDTAGGDPDKVDGVLVAPSGFVCVRGFRAWVLTEARAGRWDAANSPIENERGAAQVERWNTSHGAGSVQTFHDCRLVWTPSSGVYRMWLGDEALYLEHLLDGGAKAA